MPKHNVTIIQQCDSYTKLNYSQLAELVFKILVNHNDFLWSTGLVVKKRALARDEAKSNYLNIITCYKQHCIFYCEHAF